jgi:glycosyltransferase involved in cell wall biosynthesis
MRFFFHYVSSAQPSGGRKQIRLQSQLLQELGVDVLILRESGVSREKSHFDDDIFYNLPVKEAPYNFDEAETHLSAEDILILPEANLGNLLAKAKNYPARIGVNNQNGFYAMYTRPRQAALTSRIEFSMACSPFAAITSHHCYGLDWRNIFNTPYWMVRPPFELRPITLLSELSVCYMPRKIAPISHEVMDRVKSYYPSVPWIAIDNIPEDDVAATLRGNKIFFSAQDQEGFGMPALEAMICGCLVAGFGGTRQFPHPYVKEGNGVWAQDLNIDAAVKAVCEAIKLAQENGTQYRQIIANAQATAAQFNREEASRALKEMLDVVSNQSYGRRRVHPTRLGMIGRLQLTRLMR